MSHSAPHFIVAGAVAFGLISAPRSACAWGDQGHEVVALIADHFLEPSVKAHVDAMLTADPDGLTAHDIASEATWADRYRDSDRNSTKIHYEQTHEWHFIDLEIDRPDLNAACFGHLALPVGTPASRGPSNDCVVDKIDQFAAELSSKTTSAEERLIALKFLLHFVGDLHQPLHASDDHDAGGNRAMVKASGFTGKNLHQFWDTEVVENLGDAPASIAADLIGGIEQSKGQMKMSAGTTADWAMEAYVLAKDRAYGELPTANADGVRVLPAAYVTDAIETARIQLARAGVRLASVLNRALAN